jgi:hypothetical protein
MRKVILLGAMLACACLSGCKSEDDAKPIAQADLPAAAAHAVCESFGSCCSKASFTFDSTNCVAARTAEYQQIWGTDSSANSTYDAQAAGDCLAAFKAVAQCGQAEGSGNDSCEKILVGKLAAGQPCVSSAECAKPANGDASCSDANGTKTCQVYQSTPVTRGTEGQACSTDCADANSCSIFSSPGSAPGTTPMALVACYRSEGLFCDAGTCGKLKALGQTCAGFNSCVAGAFCDNSTSRCTAPHPNGAVCQSNNECQSDNCNTGVCGGASGVTQAECASGGVK